jgi:Uma2 family endonuclease
VSSDRQAVEVFRQDDQGNWQLANTADPVQLVSVNMAIAIAEIYEDTDISS